MQIRAAFVLTVSIASSFSAMHAQKPASPAATPDYSRESTVIEHLDRVYIYAADGTGSREVTGLLAIHDQAAVKTWSVLTIPFASSAEHVVIDYVRVRRADGTILSTPAADAQELPADVTREAPFYSDLKEEQIPVRSLREGDHLEYKFHIIRTKPEAPNRFWGEENFLTIASGTVALSETFELHIPKDVYVQVSSPKNKPTLTDTATERVYRWQASQLESVAGKTHNELLRLVKDPADRDETEPHLSTIAWTNFHTWAEVGAWYRSMEGSRTEPDDDIRAKVKELTAGKATDEEKARAIYAFVSSQVRYIGVAFGIGRYQPHQASEILSNQYGDCKDKTTLLISMLAAANISADAVLIGVNVAFDPSLPSPGAFNHAINLAHVSGQPVWLDATAEVAPYRLLNPVIRGRKALVIPLTGEAHVETTPKDPPFPSVQAFEAVGTLDDKGTSHSHITLDLRGDAEVFFRIGVRSVSPAQWDELMQRISQSFGYIGKVTNAQFSRPDDTSVPFHISYDYEREKSGDWDTLRILPQLIPIGLSDVDDKDPPVSPIQLGAPQYITSHAAMTLPPGWSAELPPAIHAKCAFATLDKTYKFEHGTLITDLRFQGLTDKVPAADWKAYHQWYKDAGLDGETYIQLINHTSPASSSTTLSKPFDDAAAKLINDAVQAERSRDWTGAKDKLDQAKALNPQQPFLYSNYGFIEAHDGKLKEAEANYKREIAAYPAETNVYPLLAAVQMRLERPTDAIATFQSEVDRNPSDETNILSLASLLQTRADYPAEEKVLRVGTAATPGNTWIKIRLGICLLHQKKTAEGQSLLRDALASNDDASQLNDAAYELGDAGVDLPLAEQSARHCLDLLDTASATGETGPAALRRTSLIFHAWDTLGWILFREGKIDEAEPWVHGAWRNDNATEVGYHLGLILESQHQPANALAQLQLASAGNRGANFAAVQKLIDAKISDLEKSSNFPGDPPAASSAGDRIASGAILRHRPERFALELKLQDQRTYNLPRGALTPTGKGSATIELDVTSKGTTAVRFVDGDQSLEPLFDAVRQINLFLSIPPQSQATILRRAVLNCSTSSICQLVLVEPEHTL